LLQVGSRKRNARQRDRPVSLGLDVLVGSESLRDMVGGLLCGGEAVPPPMS
jgi:hypothetical protein